MPKCCKNCWNYDDCSDRDGCCDECDYYDNGECSFKKGEYDDWGPYEEEEEDYGVVFEEEDT